MTCIVAIKDKSGVYIGGDSQASSGLDAFQREDPKVFKKDNMIFGFTRSYRMGQLIQYAMPEIIYNTTDPFGFLCKAFIPELLKCLKDNNYAKVSDNKASGGTFIIGFQGRIFSIEDDFQVAEPSYPYDSCGCGRPYAIGALHQIINMDLSTKVKIGLAIETAGEFSNGVGGRVDYVELKN